MKNKIIDIITVTYNHEQYIEKCIDSILSQKTIYKIKSYIGEDASSDKTAEKLNKYISKSQFHIFFRKQNLGARDNFLDLLKQCQGDYIAILDGDDYWIDSEFLEKSITYLDNHPECIATTTNIEIIDERNTVTGYLTGALKSTTISDVLFYNDIITSTLVFKNVFKDQNNFRLLKAMLFDIVVICDLALKLVLVEKGEIHRLDFAGAAYRKTVDIHEDKFKKRFYDVIHLYNNIIDNVNAKNKKIIIVFKDFYIAHALKQPYMQDKKNIKKLLSTKLWIVKIKKFLYRLKYKIKKIFKK